MKRAPMLLALLFAAQCAFGQTASDSTSRDTLAAMPRLNDQYGLLSVKSRPEGAEVFADTLYLGRTPLEKINVPAGRHTLRLFYPGARLWDALVAIDSVYIVPSREKAVSLNLDSTRAAGIGSNAFVTRPDLPQTIPLFTQSHENRFRMEYVAGGAMILSGALSAYLKTTSDNKFNTYIQNRDPALLDQVHRLDTWAGVSLVVTEISFAVLTYLFLSN